MSWRQEVRPISGQQKRAARAARFEVIGQFTSSCLRQPSVRRQEKTWPLSWQES
jgi:hypothetical protein